MPKSKAAISPGGDGIYDPSHGNGYGENALGAPLSAEMTELDLTPMTPVHYMQDDDAGWALVEWTDQKGLGRITAVEPAEFQNDFHT